MNTMTHAEHTALAITMATRLTQLHRESGDASLPETRERLNREIALLESGMIKFIQVRTREPVPV